MPGTREWIRTQKARISSQINAVNEKIDQHQATILELKAEKDELQLELTTLTSDLNTLGDT